MNTETAVPAASPQARTRPLGLIGLGLSSLGAVLVLLSFASAQWYSGLPAVVQGRLVLIDVNVSFSQVGTMLDASPNHAGLADAYFGWLGWAMLGTVGVAAAIAFSTMGRWRPVTAAPLVLASAAVVVTTLALKLTAGSKWSFWWEQSSLGFWLASIGFALAGAGAVLGPVGRVQPRE